VKGYRYKLTASGFQQLRERLKESDVKEVHDMQFAFSPSEIEGRQQINEVKSLVCWGGIYRRGESSASHNMGIYH
jgi:hypothetical protein